MTGMEIWAFVVIVSGFGLVLLSFENSGKSNKK